MTDVILQPWLNVASATARYMDNTGVAPPSYSGDMITTGFGGDRIRCSVEFSPIGGANLQTERGALAAFLFAMQGRQNRLYITPAENRPRGAFPTGELLANTAFANTTGWTSSSTGNSTITASQRLLRLKRVAVGADATIQGGGVATTSGAYYVARAFLNAGKGAMDYRLRLGLTAGANDVAASAADITAQGMATLVGLASASTTHYSILDGISSRSIGDYQDVAYASMARCPVVDGAGQTGSALAITGLPVSTDDLILPGQFFEVITSRGSELKVCKAPVHGDSAGKGYLRFGPPLRGTVADLAPIILHQPFGYFIAPGDAPDLSTEPGLISRSSLDVVEAA